MDNAELYELLQHLDSTLSSIQTIMYAVVFVLAVLMWAYVGKK